MRLEKQFALTDVKIDPLVARVKARFKAKLVSLLSIWSLAVENCVVDRICCGDEGNRLVECEIDEVLVGPPPSDLQLVCTELNSE